MVSVSIKTLMQKASLLHFAFSNASTIRFNCSNFFFIMRLLHRLFISLLQAILNHSPYCLFGVIVFFCQGSDVCPIILSDYALLYSLGIKQMYRECYLLTLVHLVDCYCGIQTQLSADFTVDFIKKLSFIVFHFFTTFPF